MDPWQSWGLILLGVAVAYFYYSQQYNNSALNKNRPLSAITEVTQHNSKPSKRDERVKKRPEHVRNGTNGPSTPDHASSISSHSKSEEKLNGVEKKDNSSSDKQWAQQMANVRKGTTLAPPASNGSRPKTVKTSSATSSPAASSVSAYSAGEEDVDDDLSSKASPDLETSNAGDISDMLEPKGPAISVLRLTGTESDQPKRTHKPQKEFVTQETKKQRQNKKKIEERKEASQEAEKERLIKLENQRRVAREGRGEPAKNGLQTAKAPSSSVWNPTSNTDHDSTTTVSADKSTTNHHISQGGAAPVQPIKDIVHRSQAPAIGNAQVSIVPTHSKEWTNGLSEDEQMRMVTKMSEDESGWNTVDKKKTKKNQVNGTVESSNDTKSDTSTTQNTYLSYKPKATSELTPPVAPKLARQQSNGFSALEMQSHPDDSEFGA